MKRLGSLLTLVVLALSACDDSTGPDGLIRHTFDFQTGTQGWQAIFADYPVGGEAQFRLDADHKPLPAPLDATRKGFFITGDNRSDDLMMLITRRIDELEPNAKYRVRFEIELATNAPRSCVGVGGAPGESVYVKAGAAPTKIERIVDEIDHYRIAVDVGQQSQHGKYARVIGNVANQNSDCTRPVYQMKKLVSDAELEVQADAAGSLWVLVGTDSGFESETTLWYTRVDVRLVPVRS